MLKFAKVLHSILFVVGYLAIAVLASVISYYGKPELGLGIMVTLSVMTLVFVAVSWVVKSRHKRAVRAVAEAQVAGVSGPTKTCSAHATEAYDYDAHTVWSLIRPAENAVLLTDAQRAFTVPGTPTGVGEQQCFIGRDGSVSIVEIIGEESPWWATTRPVTPTQVNTRSTYKIEPTPTGCTLTMGIVIEVPASARLAEHPQEWWESQARPYLKRVSEVLSARRG